MKNFVERIKSLRIVLVLAIIIIAIISIIKINEPKPRELNSLERIAIAPFIEDVTSHLEEIDFVADGEDSTKETPLSEISLDRYIAYALEYSYDKDETTELSVKEIKKLIAKLFDVSLDTEKLNEVGITPLLLDKHVDHEPVGKKYSIRKTGFTKQEIAGTSLAKYIQTDIHAEQDDYVVTFDKYTIKNPHDAITHSENGDYSGVNDYLEGKGHSSAIKKLVTAENAASVGPVEKQTTIHIIVKDDKLIVKSIK